jgi:cysteine desulfurase/selenocysteine lyase
MTLPDYDLAAVRAEFPLIENCVYLNHAGAGPLPLRAQRAMQQGLSLLSEAGPHLFKQAYEQVSVELRRRLATLINAQAGEIALAANTATGFNLIVHGLPLSAGDNVLMCDQEFPGVVYPFQNLQRLRGIEARLLPNDGGGLTVDLLNRHADSRTRAVAVSSVEFANGFRADLGAIGAWCRERDIWLLVDGMQSLGVMPLDVGTTDVDVLVSGGYKWLLAPPGTGFMYVRPKRLEQLDSIFVGADSVVDAEDYLNYNLTLLAGARRFEFGVPNRLGAFGFCESLGLIQEVGIERIQHWALHLTDVLLAGLEKAGWQSAIERRLERRSAIVAVRPPADGTLGGISQALLNKRIIHSVREGCLRFSPHFYNTEAEIEQVVQALA